MLPPPLRCDCNDIENGSKNSPQRTEITLDSIYECMESSFFELKDKELALELQVSQPNYEMLEIWQYVQSQNKTIIVISDMYLPKDLIAQMLEKNGFTGYSSLYVSSQSGYTKASGLLFDHVARDLEVEASRILHIGDNYESDVVWAKKCGFQAIFYKKIIERYLLEHEADNIFYLNFPKDLGASILLSLKALHWHKKVLNIAKEDYWSAMGYEYAGPVAYAYMYFVAGEAQRLQIEQMLFIARDGYTLQKVFDGFQTQVQTRYVYAPRFFSVLYKLLHKDEEHRARAIVNFLAKKYKDIDDLRQGAKSCLEILEKHKEVFQNAAKKEFALYADYIHKVLESMGVKAGWQGMIGMVDTVTSVFSAQTLLQEAMQEQNLRQSQNSQKNLPPKQQSLHAFYWLCWHTYPPEQMPPCSFFSPDIYLSSNAPQKWDFVEFLLTSPELPIKGLDSNYKPIYDENPSKHELKRQSVYPHIANHALLFASDLKAIFGMTNVYFTPQLITAYLDCFYQNPTQNDIENMQHIFHDSDETHYTYAPLFTQQVKVKDFLKSYRKTKKRLLESKWVTKKQYKMLALFYPININIRGIKKLELCLLPYIPPVFGISARLFGYCNLKFSIGRFHEQ